MLAVLPKKQDTWEFFIRCNIKQYNLINTIFVSILKEVVDFTWINVHKRMVKITLTTMMMNWMILCTTTILLETHLEIKTLLQDALV